MFHCVVCDENISLTEEQRENMLLGDKVKIACSCGTMNMLVWVELNDKGHYVLMFDNGK